MPKVTVLMPVYNGERYLREAIDSILAQTFPDFEFLIINDGSTDNTREIICSYDEPRIRLIDNDYNLGLTRSLNKGLKLAEGEFIARQDADDVSEPERLAKQVTFLKTHPEVTLVGTWYKYIDPQGSLIGECNLPCKSTQIRWEILFYCPFVHSAVMFRKYTIVEQIGFYNEALSYAQDYDLWWRIVRQLQVANLNEYLIKLRSNPDSMTATYGNIVDDEPLQINCTNIGYLLGWEKTKTWNDGVFLRAMTLFWIGTSDELKDLTLVDLNQIIEEIFRIHQDFCKYYNLDGKECKKHRNQVYAQIIDRLFELIYYYWKKDKFTALQLLNRACRLNFSILLTKKIMNLFLKFIIGAQLVREIRQVTQENLKLEQN
ncbi:glycosyltransferase family 2 protein [Dendronalium sp. ChiSLP03b]|uniref:glycosyltransferase family 2 protein n=1 Tax=Dendronalium sp. ChiSLP03b TaxID=3075381 RepID=UPI002AD21219|nr:glycosyltransferase [Dendronalium sp. ChiSLP03b]MDZ8206524.1 glycosyltransferase [Dendronalium sp. ChiSLP03b]